MQENTIVKGILAYLRSRDDCFCWKEHGGMYGTAGLPDIVCCYKGKFVAFEVKQPKGKVTDLQRRTIEQINSAGGAAMVVRSVDEVKERLRDLEV